MSTLEQDFHLSRANMLTFLSESLRSNGRIDSTLYLPPGLTLAETVSYVRTVCPDEIPDQAASMAQASVTGFCLFAGPVISLVLPPFPVKEKSFFTGLETAPLLSSLQQDWTVSIVLVRLGSFAVGVFRGEDIIDSKVGTGLVHGRHRQGGSSANRFYRHRQKQIEQFLIRVCGHISERIGPSLEKLDYLAYGGAWTTIELLKKQCQFLVKLRVPELPPLLDIAEPRQEVLNTSIGRVWSSHVVQWSHD